MRRPIISGGRRIVAGVAALLVLTLAAAAQLASEAVEPTPVPAGAPDHQFSAGRATEILADIADQPRPLGSQAHDRVRDELADRLTDLGFDTDIESGVGGAHFEDETVIGKVDNVVGTLPGTDPTGHLLLVTHYDSVPSGPGAADAGMPVVSILEAVRALLADGNPRNDLTVVFSD
ncbi:MAG: M28 family peptidase, partial [Stackebrandtia sp.]